MAHSTEFHEWLLSMYVRATIRIVVMAVLLALISSAANAAGVLVFSPAMTEPGKISLTQAMFCPRRPEPSATWADSAPGSRQS